ncbi:15500_t:CDS:1, partial [Racocetra persica]
QKLQLIINWIGDTKSAVYSKMFKNIASQLKSTKTKVEEKVLKLYEPYLSLFVMLAGAHRILSNLIPLSSSIMSSSDGGSVGT